MHSKIITVSKFLHNVVEAYTVICGPLFFHLLQLQMHDPLQSFIRALNLYVEDGNVVSYHMPYL
jgi:hypothetical protein